MIRQNIQNNRLEEANEEFLSFCLELNSLREEVTQLSARLRDLRNREHAETLAPEERKKNRNLIVESLLYYCGNAERLVAKYFPGQELGIGGMSLEEEIGRKLRGRYENFSSPSSGSTAIFYQANQTGTERQVMLRVIPSSPYLAGAGELNEKELQKLQRAIRIKHRNIINIIAADVEQPPHVIALDYINGVSLDHVVGRVPLSRELTLSIIEQLCQAIYYLHINDLVHKSIKPDKILIDYELVPVISLYDIIGSHSRGKMLSSDQLLYGAPELLKTAKVEPTTKSDQFSMGLLIYQLMTGHPLFCPKHPESNDPLPDEQWHARMILEERTRFFKSKTYQKQLLQFLPPELRTIVKKMLAETPANRYANLKQVLKAIRAIDPKSSPEAIVAGDSYQRCCIARADFTALFYKELFNAAKHHEKINDFFTQSGKNPEDRKRFKILRLAIDALIHVQTEPAKFEQLLQMKQHEGVDLDWHKSFVDTIIDSVERYDPLWEEHLEAESAWEAIRQAAYESIERTIVPPS